jgi:glycosyltransferase involved in cell wall biosynthesis
LRHFGTGRQRRFVGDVLADGRYDAVVADTPYPLTALPPYNSRDRTAVPVVVNTHNVEAEVWRSAGPAADGGRLPVTMDRLLAARWEVKALAQADGIAFCSARDADVLRKAVGADTVCAIVPNAVDTRTITLLPEPQSDDEVLFLGGLRYGPNAEAARFIVSRVAPLLLTAHCAVSIVGGLAGDIGCSSSPPNVRFMGRVRDVKPAYERCYATIVPLFSGSGTRLKVLESFAYGRPVVSSAKGVEGLAVQPERHYLQAEDAGQFVSQILRLRQDPHLVRDLVKNARDLAETRHSWATAGRAFHRLTEDVIERFA